MRLSIAMTTYNGMPFLPVQLESIAAQTLLPDELVVCDDGSTDGTVACLEQFAASVPFAVRIVRNAENLGHERNFSQAVDLCRGDLIFLADQDDWWRPAKLERVRAEFERDPGLLLLVNDVMITDGELHPTGRTLLAQMRSSGLFGKQGKGMTLGCATTLRAPLKALVSPIPPLDFGHDSWVHEFATLIGARRVIENDLQLYRRHGGNASLWAFDGDKRATALTLMRPSAGQDLTEIWQKRIRAFALMAERLRALGAEGFDALGTRRTYAQALADAEHAVRAIRRRSEVFRRGWWERKRLAFELLARGDYAHFLGWRSFAKDLVR